MQSCEAEANHHQFSNILGFTENPAPDFLIADSIEKNGN